MRRRLSRAIRVRGLLLLLLAGAALAVAMGGARGSAGNPADSSGPPNTVGVGGHARTLRGPAPVAVSKFSDTVQAVLGGAGAAQATVLATVGAGSVNAQLLAVTLPDGRICLTVAHAAGNIVEPPNCASDASLRVWSGTRGEAGSTPAQGVFSSMRVIAAVSADVKSVRIAFSDGSSRTLQPDGNGVVTLEVAGGGPAPTQVDALAAGGSSLGLITF